MDSIQRRLERAVQEHPSDPVRYYELGRWFREQGEERYGNAVRILDRAVSLYPNYVAAHFELGMVYSLMRQYDSAVREWERMTDEDGDFVLDQAVERDRTVADVVAIWENYLSLFSTPSPIVHFNVGFVFLILHQYDRALREFQATLRQNPRYDTAQYLAGLALLRRGDRELAEKAFQAEVGVRSNVPNTHYWLSSVQFELGRQAQAQKSLQEALRLRPNYVKANLRMGQLLARAGHVEQAVPYLQTAVSLSPNQAGAHLMLAEILQNQYQLDAAVSHYEEALRIDPANRAAHYQTGLVYKMMGRADAALEHLSKAADLDPNDAEAHYSLGQLNSQVGHDAEAIRNYSNALTVAPNHPYAQYALGLAYQKNRQPSEAAREFERVVTNNPRDVKARAALGEAYFSMGKMDNAIQEFLRVLDQNPLDLKAHYFHGAALLRSGRTDDAIQAYHKVVSSQPNSPYAHFSLGAVYVRAGEYDLARESFAQATSFDPTNEADLNLMATLHLMGAIGIWHAESSKQLKENLKKLEFTWRRTIEAMVNAVDQRDEYTRQHSVKVSTVATFLAEFLKLAPKDIEAIHYGGLLHDIGKIGIPDFILRKPGKLTDWEFEVMKEHPTRGWEIVKELDLPWNIQPMIEYHHERFDGSGYPYGLKGKDIPLSAQIMTLSDFWDALRSQRSYKKAFTGAATLEEMQKLKSKHFDPWLVDQFEPFIDWSAAVKGEKWTVLYPP
ncbi:MAG TPA: tetratricopeptide repeat protein [Candidatus Xenobia bacterium]